MSSWLFIKTLPLLVVIMLCDYVKDYEQCIIACTWYMTGILYHLTDNMDRILYISFWTMRLSGTMFGLLRIVDLLVDCTIGNVRGITCIASYDDDSNVAMASIVYVALIGFSMAVPRFSILMYSLEALAICLLVCMSNAAMWEALTHAIN